MRTHLAIFFADRGDVTVLKSHVIKSPNLIGWLYWRFAAMTVENRGNEHTWRMPANLIADISGMRRSAKIAIAAPGTAGDFRRSWRSAYKITKCVAGLNLNVLIRYIQRTLLDLSLGLHPRFRHRRLVFHS